MDIKYRKATMADLDGTAAFVDYWLKGEGKRDGAYGATDDYFVPIKRHIDYIRNYEVLLALYEGSIIGWAVKTNKGVLIHLLIAGPFRRKGIGGELLKRLAPQTVRSKFDQESGDPAPFYEKHGYVKKQATRTGKKLNIDIFVSKEPGVEQVEPARRSIDKLVSRW